jgi:hypothetical protein
MNVFNDGWMHWLGGLCVLYILFGSKSIPKAVAFVVLLVIAILEFCVAYNIPLFGHHWK